MVIRPRCGVSSIAAVSLIFYASDYFGKLPALFLGRIVVSVASGPAGGPGSDLARCPGFGGGGAWEQGSAGAGITGPFFFFCLSLRAN